ncbi:MAG: hypothetical protein WC703_07205 [Candidatus Neomarinimicrobiota bacterium]
MNIGIALGSGGTKGFAHIEYLKGIRAFEFYKFQEVFDTLPDDIAWFRTELKKHGL